MTNDSAGAFNAPEITSYGGTTNVRKTSLIRTLLGKDVGETKDEPHVTQATAPRPDDLKRGRLAPVGYAGSVTARLARRCDRNTSGSWAVREPGSLFNKNCGDNAWHRFAPARFFTR
jgi:hypothetical protein